MKLWADCGRSSMAISGMGGHQGNPNRKVETTNKDGNPMSLDAHDPARAKWAIMWEHFGDQIDRGMLQQAEKEYSKHWRKWDAAKKRGDIKAYQLEEKILARIVVLQHSILMAPYHALPPEEREAFDQKMGINEWAAPEIGEAFTISSGGAAYEEGAMTWNYHFAGVVMRAGGDAVVLENYAVGDYEAENTRWVFQMYGPATKPDQTFHEQHMQSSAHGKTPITMEVMRK
jgi:hypothetical protein